jgi:hypothetical protein
VSRDVASPVEGGFPPLEGDWEVGLAGPGTDDGFGKAVSSAFPPKSWTQSIGTAGSLDLPAVVELEEKMFYGHAPEKGRQQRCLAGRDLCKTS